MSAEPILLTRRLTTVLLADIVGYSRMMSRDEAGALARIARHAWEFIQPTVDRHRGRLVRSLGDGILIEFGTAIDAVLCALDIQRGLSERQADDPERFQLRMGINNGDVLADGRDIYGNSINIAARLETLSQPGTVYVSQSIYDQTRSHPGLFFTDKGMFRGKNIEYPIRAYQVADAPMPASSRWFRAVSNPALLPVAAIAIVLIISGVAWLPDLGPVTSPNSAVIAPPSSASATPPNSIIVLPFRNLSGRPDEEYVADAITDDVITDLSRLQRAMVIASGTALAYKNQIVDVRQIGREVGARFALEGSVKRVGAAVQVNAQLVDTQSGAQLWANRFNHEGTSLLALQEAITGRIAATLNVQLAQVQRRHEIGTLAADGNPLDERLRAMAILAGPDYNAEKSLEARRHVDAALLVYPDSPQLLAVLGNLLLNDYYNAWNNAGSAEVDAAEWAAKKALSLDPAEPVANYVLGLVLRVRGDHDGALAAFEEAIRRNPNFASAHAQMANQLVFLGRPTQDAIDAAQKAIALSPKDRSLGVFYWIGGRAYFAGGDMQNAIEWLRRSVEERPNLWYSQAWLIAAYALSGRNDEAQSVLAVFTQRFPKYNTRERIRAHYTTNIRHRNISQEAKDNLLKGLQMAGLPET
jgi:TolB-like protein/class 3 adenylate cyclase